MHILPILLVAVSVAMDAFGVSVSNGIFYKKKELSFALHFGIYFGIFQFIMPIIGYIFYLTFSPTILSYSNWISFVLLILIGGKMIYEALNKSKDNTIANIENITNFKNMVMLSIATSIDAMAVGLTLSLMGVNIIFASLVIGLVTFILSTLGAYLGSTISKYIKNGELIGGIILILMGIKIILGR